MRIQYGDATQVSYTYDADGNVLTAADGVTGESETNTYDSLGNRTAYTRGGYSESCTYDAYGKIASFVQGTRTYSYAYKNNAARDLDHITAEGYTVTPETDIIHFSYSSVKKKQNRKKYRLWLTDKDLLMTYSKPFITSVNYSRGSKFHKFGVKFSFRNEKIICYSKHYDNIVLLYENKPMKLLYSPKFDEVLIVEDK